jgi:transcription initiation factor TFIIB
MSTNTALQEARRVEEQTRCPECGSTDLIRDYPRGEVLCNNCGLVLSENLLDQGPEWRDFEESGRQSASRVGAPTNYMIYDKGLSTEIPMTGRDAQGKALTADARVRFYRMRMLHNQVRQSRKGERSLAEGLRQVERFASRMGLPPALKQQAGVIYRKAAQAGIVRGRSIATIAAACIYVTCRINGFPRTLREIATALKLDKKKLSRTYSVLARQLKLRVPSSTPEEYLPKIADQLGLKGETRADVARMLRELSKNPQFSSMLPTGTVAAAIYVACVVGDERRSQDQIAKAAGVSEVTLRNRARQIAQTLGIEPFPPEGKTLMGWKGARKLA